MRPQQIRFPTTPLQVAEQAVYFLGAAALIIAAGGLLVVTTIEVIEGTTGDLTQTIVTVLDRMLLAFILLELGHSIHVVLREQALVAEPFLLIGLIAVVRRILVLTAQAERLPLKSDQVQNLVLELGILTVLVIALAGALYFLYPAPDRGRWPPRAASREREHGGERERGGDRG
jgi:uncharacterized membrane protein (DUF373 family)